MAYRIWKVCDSCSLTNLSRRNACTQCRSYREGRVVVHSLGDKLPYNSGSATALSQPSLDSHPHHQREHSNCRPRECIKWQKSHMRIDYRLMSSLNPLAAPRPLPPFCTAMRPHLSHKGEAPRIVGCLVLLCPASCIATKDRYNDG